MHIEQIRQDNVPAAEPPEQFLYLVDDCCGMMIFSNEPPAPKRRATHMQEEEYASH